MTAHHEHRAVRSAQRGRGEFPQRHAVGDLDDRGPPGPPLPAVRPPRCIAELREDPRPAKWRRRDLLQQRDIDRLSNDRIEQVTASDVLAQQRQVHAARPAQPGFSEVIGWG